MSAHRLQKRLQFLLVEDNPLVRDLIERGSIRIAK